jgi:hypothetical protein
MTKQFKNFEELDNALKEILDSRSDLSTLGGRIRRTLQQDSEKWQFDRVIEFDGIILPKWGNFHNNSYTFQITRQNCRILPNITYCIDLTEDSYDRTTTRELLNNG